MILTDRINKFEAIRNLVGGRLAGDGDANKVIYIDNQTPPSEEEITKEMKRMQTEYDSLAYARHRAGEYPTIEEMTVALYDTDDKAALETKRAAVKKKWPKDNSGPVGEKLPSANTA